MTRNTRKVCQGRDDHDQELGDISARVEKDTIETKRKHFPEKKVTT